MADKWQNQARCRDSDPDMFVNRARVVEAQKVCADCPVTAQCELFAAEATAGVWAGVDRTQKNAKKSLTNSYLEEHGSKGAYDRHIRRGERPCQRCITAQLFDWHEREAVRPQARKRGRVSA